MTITSEQQSLFLRCCTGGGVAGGDAAADGATLFVFFFDDRRPSGSSNIISLSRFAAFVCCVISIVDVAVAVVVKTAVVATDVIGIGVGIGVGVGAGADADATLLFTNGKYDSMRKRDDNFVSFLLSVCPYDGGNDGGEESAGTNVDKFETLDANDGAAAENCE